MDKDDAIKYADAIQLIINIPLPFQIRDSICDFIYEEKELLDVTDLNGENYIPVNSKDTKKLVLSNIQKNILIEYFEKYGVLKSIIQIILKKFFQNIFILLKVKQNDN